MFCFPKSRINENGGNEVDFFSNGSWYAGEGGNEIYHRHKFNQESITLIQDCLVQGFIFDTR